MTTSFTSLLLDSPKYRTYCCWRAPLASYRISVDLCESPIRTCFVHIFWLTQTTLLLIEPFSRFLLMRPLTYSVVVVFIFLCRLLYLYYVVSYAPLIRFVSFRFVPFFFSFFFFVPKTIKRLDGLVKSLVTPTLPPRGPWKFLQPNKDLGATVLPLLDKRGQQQR